MKRSRGMLVFSLKKMLILLMITGSLFPCVRAYGSVTSAWHRKCALTVNHTKLTGDVSDFPVLLLWTGTQATSDLPQEMFDADGSYPAKSDGSDVRFTSDSAGTTELPFEIVANTFSTNNDPSLARAEIWVKLSSISSSADTTFYIWYNNSSASAYAVGATYGRNNTWDMYYKGVWHLPNGTSLSATDSTSNGNDGTIAGPTASSGGQIDGAGNFSNNNITIPTNNFPFGSADVTTSAWYNGTPHSPFACLFSYGSSSSGKANGIFANPVNSSTLYFFWSSYGPGLSTNARPSTNAWHQFTFTYGGGNTSTLYVDGAYDNSSTAQAENTSAGSNNSIGRWVDNSQPLNGLLDEVRISAATRSADWVKAEYNTEYSPQTFVTVGTPGGTSSASMFPLF